MEVTRWCLLGAAVAPRTGKIIKNGFERGENLLQNGILNFAFTIKPIVGIWLDS